MSRSKKTQAQLQSKIPIRYAYMGDEKVEGELDNFCNDILALIDDNLVP